MGEADQLASLTMRSPSNLPPPAVPGNARNVLARSITCRLGVLAPEHRSAHLALLGPLLLEEIGRALGAELAYYFATPFARRQLTANEVLQRARL